MEHHANLMQIATQGMYMKGEGTEPNYSRAVTLYELAAKEGHVRALNGLGFEYFHGHVLLRNEVSLDSDVRFALVTSCAIIRKK